MAGIAAHEHLLNGGAFGLSSLLLFLGPHSVLRAYGRNREVFEPARRVTIFTISSLGPVVLLAQQFSGSLDLERYRLTIAGPGADCGPGGLPTGAWIDLVIVGVALVAVIVLALKKERLPRPSTAPTVGVGVAVAGADREHEAVRVPGRPDDHMTCPGRAVHEVPRC